MSTPGTQRAERGVGVDGHHPVILADLREAQPHAALRVTTDEKTDEGR